MSEVFSRRAELGVKLATLALAIGAIAGIVFWTARLRAVDIAGVPSPQPVPFSHKHHVGDIGLDCRYCHSTVETAAFAGNAGDRDLPHLSLAALRRRAAAGAAASKRRNRASRSPGHGCTSCPISSTSITASTSPRASAASNAMAGSTRCRSNGGANRCRCSGASTAIAIRARTCARTTPCSRCCRSRRRARQRSRCRARAASPIARPATARTR